MYSIYRIFIVVILFCFTCNAQQSMTKIIAHRGAWKEFQLPQNSMASLKKAIEIGAHGSEFDVHRTADNQLIVFHDDELNGKKIEDYLWNELKQFPLSNGETIPLLTEFLALKDELNNTKLILEIKSSPTQVNRTLQTVKLVADQITSQNIDKNKIEFILFSWEGCLQLKKLLHDYSISYLNGDRTVDELMKNSVDGFDYHYSLLIKDFNIIRNAKDNNLQTNAWTVNSIQIAKQLINAKIDYLTTDYPHQFMNEL